MHNRAPVTGENGVPQPSLLEAILDRRMSRNSLVTQALNNEYLKRKGVPSMRDLWVRFKYGEQAHVTSGHGCFGIAPARRETRMAGLRRAQSSRGVGAGRSILSATRFAVLDSGRCAVMSDDTS